LNISLEDYFISKGAVYTNVHIEFALPNGAWPTSFAKENHSIELKQFTIGLNNLGNSNLFSL